jgi:hypothetical protein
VIKLHEALMATSTKGWRHEGEQPFVDGAACASTHAYLARYLASFHLWKGHIIRFSRYGTA